MKCPYCESDISESARKCSRCGEWVKPSGKERASDTAIRTDPPSSRAAAASPHVTIVKEESVLFAVITFIFYILVYPLGVLLNLIGLFTGPKKGCFGAMFLLLCLMPIGAVTVFVVTGAAVGISVVDENIARLKQFVGKGGPTTAGSGNFFGLKSADSYDGTWSGKDKELGLVLEIEFTAGSTGGKSKLATLPWQEFKQIDDGQDPGNTYAAGSDQFSFEIKNGNGRLRYYGNGNKLEFDMRRTR